MTFSGIIHDRLVKNISGHLDRSRNNYSSHGNHCNICSSGANIHYQISKGLGYIQSCSDGCCNRLLHHINIHGSRLISSFLYCLSLNLCNSAWNTNTDPGLTESTSSHCFGNKIFQHFFHNIIIYDHALSDRADNLHIRSNVCLRTACFFPDCSDLLCIFIINYNGRLIKHQTSCCRISQTVPGPQVNSNITCRHRNPLSFCFDQADKIIRSAVCVFIIYNFY